MRAERELRETEQQQREQTYHERRRARRRQWLHPKTLAEFAILGLLAVILISAAVNAMNPHPKPPSTAPDPCIKPGWLEAEIDACHASQDVGQENTDNGYNPLDDQSKP